MGIALKTNHLSFGYDGALVLDDVTFELRPEEILAVIGPNGAGKSTLLKCVDGLLTYRKGCIEVDGNNIRKIHRRALARFMAYVPQTMSTIFPFKVLDMVLQGRYPHGRYRRRQADLDKAFNALELMGIADLAMRDFQGISGGQQQKVTIARALAQEASILLLDEPTSNLDIFHQLEVMETIRYLVKQSGISAMISIHDLNLAARYADTLIMLKQGRIIAKGTPSFVLTPENIARVYNVEVNISHADGRPCIVPLKPMMN